MKVRIVESSNRRNRLTESQLADSVLDSQNICELKDEGAEFLYPANPEFFNKYFKSMSIPGFKANGRRRYCYAKLNISNKILEAIPAAAKRRIGVSRNEYEIMFGLESIVTEDSLETYKGTTRFSVGDVVSVDTFKQKNTPVSLDIEDIFDTTINKEEISRIDSVLEKIYNEYTKAVELSKTNPNYREMSSTQLIQYLIKNKFGKEVSISVEEYGIPSKYANRPRQAGSGFSGTFYDVKDDIASKNHYNLFVEPQLKGERNTDLAYQINDYVEELSRDKHLEDLGISINAGGNLRSLDNDIGRKRNDAWKDFIVLGYAVSGPRSLLFDTKSKRISDIVLG